MVRARANSRPARDLRLTCRAGPRGTASDRSYAVSPTVAGTPGPVSRLLPQQQLVLELLRMSGEIAVMGSAEGTILWRTLQECRQHLWVAWTEVSPGVFSVSLTAAGRLRLDSAAGA